MQRRWWILAPTSKHDADRYQHRVSRQEMPSEERCRHKLFSVVPIVSVCVEGGYVGRCLMCGMSGPVRSSEQAARGVVLEQVVLNEG
jgi:hypothetical protein